MDAGKAALEAIKQVINAAGQVVTWFVSVPLTGLANILGQSLLAKFNILKAVFTSAVDFISSLPIMDWLEKLQSAFSSAFDSIASAISPLVDAVLNFSNYLVSLVTDFQTQGHKAQRLELHYQCLM